MKRKRESLTARQGKRIEELERALDLQVAVGKLAEQTKRLADNVGTLVGNMGAVHGRLNGLGLELEVLRQQAGLDAATVKAAIDEALRVDPFSKIVDGMAAVRSAIGPGTGE
ncbi:MAG: hypothetical protein M3167_06070 [Acidobacteriota bacterium]|nr:hypothetical protein [Acidobacteriota bacterium]